MHTRIILASAALLAVPAAWAASGFTLSSGDLAQGAQVALAQVHSRYGCDGGNQSPALAWHAAPEGTRSYAVRLFDPDANGGKGWWHWLVTAIPASRHTLPAGAGDQQGALAGGGHQWKNDFGDAAYGGPCPPAGDPPHHYVLTVDALDVASLTLPADSSAAQVQQAIQRHSLAHASITTHYGR
ncbi:MAG TPA: YbhB/YbcL family Raf kinase inhibitor-like protein [Rhodanobacteraceae bacterium]|nr:YbhB/YbcL family Raf kinase inhibitor-like protein [Rhodanobacteraceae bacterium]